MQTSERVGRQVGRGKYLVSPVSQDPLEGYRCAMSYCDLSLTFDPDSVKMFSTVIFETCFPYDNDIWIAANLPDKVWDRIRPKTYSPKFSHITPQMKKLHWLPVRHRVQFIIGLITYKILNQGQPALKLIQPYTSSRSTPKL